MVILILAGTPGTFSDPRIQVGSVICLLIAIGMDAIYSLVNNMGKGNDGVVDGDRVGMGRGKG